MARVAFMLPDSAWDESYQSHPAEEEQEDCEELGVAYAADMGIDPNDPAYGYESETSSFSQRQIAAEAWSEAAEKKEN
jgi:hypothetical protein